MTSRLPLEHLARTLPRCNSYQAREAERSPRKGEHRARPRRWRKSASRHPGRPVGGRRDRAEARRRRGCHPGHVPFLPSPPPPCQGRRRGATRPPPLDAGPDLGAPRGNAEGAGRRDAPWRAPKRATGGQAREGGSRQTALATPRGVSGESRHGSTRRSERRRGRAGRPLSRRRRQTGRRTGGQARPRHRGWRPRRTPPAQPRRRRRRLPWLLRRTCGKRLRNGRRLDGPPRLPLGVNHDVSRDGGAFAGCASHRVPRRRGGLQLALPAVAVGGGRGGGGREGRIGGEEAGIFSTVGIRRGAGRSQPVDREPRSSPSRPGEPRPPLGLASPALLLLQRFESRPKARPREPGTHGPLEPRGGGGPLEGALQV